MIYLPTWRAGPRETQWAMVTTHPCKVSGCDGQVRFDLGPYIDVEEVQVIQSACSRCREVHTLRTNLNRRMR